MLHVSQWKAQPPTESVVKVVDLGIEPSGSLNEAQSKRLFARFGITCANEMEVVNAEQATQAAKVLGNRIVLKILSSEILHKGDVGGVAVNLNAEQIGERLEMMSVAVKANADMTPDKFLVQEMVSGGTELILGMHRDPLGTAILLGMGGVTAELLKDTTMRLLPTAGGLSNHTAREMVMELKTWPLLNGYRGRPLADVDALVAAIVSFSGMVAQLGERLSEAEINPLFVLERGQGVKAADGIVVFNPEARTI